MAVTLLHDTHAGLSLSSSLLPLCGSAAHGPSLNLLGAAPAAQHGSDRQTRVARHRRRLDDTRTHASLDLPSSVHLQQVPRDCLPQGLVAGDVQVACLFTCPRSSTVVSILSEECASGLSGRHVSFQLRHNVLQCGEQTMGPCLGVGRVVSGYGCFMWQSRRSVLHVILCSE